MIQKIEKGSIITLKKSTKMAKVGENPKDIFNRKPCQQKKHIWFWPNMLL
ncbi:hypothetical protein [Pedobacter sp. MW01-1-1]